MLGGDAGSRNIQNKWIMELGITAFKGVN